jgi:2-phospho-L-lactate/phosphoenolpyruvate guanylyltransferase
MRTLAILPVKTFGRAKQRLGSAVEDRGELAAAMVADVLEALGQVRGLDGVIVVSAEDVAGADGNDGIEWVPDTLEIGQSSATARGILAAIARSADRVLLVPGDCPALDPAEVDELLASASTGVVIVPDRHGSGTNALLLDPPTIIEPAFGPGSFARHAALAAGAGATVRVGRLPSLELDVDTPGDLAALRAALDERPDAAPRTRAVLERLATPTAR